MILSVLKSLRVLNIEVGMGEPFAKVGSDKHPNSMVVLA